MLKRTIGCILLLCMLAGCADEKKGSPSSPSGAASSPQSASSPEETELAEAEVPGVAMSSAKALDALKEANPIGNTLTAELDAIYSGDKNFHGSVLIAQNGTVLLSKGYGMADNVLGTVCEPGTKFPIGSMTKQFTAMAVMQLYEKGLLDLDDPLSKYYPAFPSSGKITLRNLLAQNSGLRDYINNDWKQLSLISFSELTAENIISVTAGKPLFYTPKTKFHYSNTNYLILGAIVSKVSGMPYYDYLKKYIFAPLGMKNTGPAYSQGKENYAAVGYQMSSGYLPTVDSEGNFIWGQEHYNSDKLLMATYGAGGLASTVEDLYLWDRALYTDELLSAPYREMMFSGQVQIGGGDAYGFGWRIAQNDSFGRIVWHDGLIQGFTSCIYRYIDKNITVIVLTNIDGGTIGRKAIEKVLG